MESKNFLVKVGTSSKVISVTESDSLKHVIKETFGLDSYNADDIFLQRYDKTWEDYLDVDAITDLKDHDKLQCLLNTTNEENSGEKEPDYTIYINSPNSSSAESKTSSATPCETWPAHFKLPEEKHSTQLKRHLKEELPLNWGCKHELLGTIVDEIFKYTYYPSTYEVTSAAKCLTDSYPYLTENLHNGLISGNCYLQLRSYPKHFS